MSHHPDGQVNRREIRGDGRIGDPLLNVRCNAFGALDSGLDFSCRNLCFWPWRR